MMSAYLLRGECRKKNEELNVMKPEEYLAKRWVQYIYSLSICTLRDLKVIFKHVYME